MLLFEFSLYPIGNMHSGFVFTLLYISKSVQPSYQCSSTPCAPLPPASILMNSCLDTFLDQPVAPNIPDSYLDKTKSFFKTGVFCKCYQEQNNIFKTALCL
jgi:hypothetical protein